jgi:hypothetical protein
MVEPDPLTLMLYPGATQDHDISEDPMIEEFAASLVGSQIIAWPSLERLPSTSATPQLSDEAPAVAAPQLEDALASCVLWAPPPRPIQWVVDSLKTRTVDLTVDGPSSSPPGVTHQVVDNDDSAKRRLYSFVNNVMRKRDSPLIREPPKQPPAKSVLSWRSRRLAVQSLSRVPASKRGEVLIM